MSAELLELTGRIEVLAIAVTAAAWAKALASVLRVLIEEAARTSRFNRSVEGASPDQRSEIIKAWSRLERRRGAAP
jgi:hypothetical protein